jgi:hypothetical protein
MVGLVVYHDHPVFEQTGWFYFPGFYPGFQAALSMEAAVELAFGLLSEMEAKSRYASGLAGGQGYWLASVGWG